MIVNTRGKAPGPRQVVRGPQSAEPRRRPLDIVRAQPECLVALQQFAQDVLRRVRAVRKDLGRKIGVVALRLFRIG